MLRVTAYSEASDINPNGRVRHRSVYVKGPHYDAMEDNDLRGMLDGTFSCGWNQPGQVHVRLGRVWERGSSAEYGEHEIFRVIQRWSDLRLPPNAAVHSARLELAVEWPPVQPVRLVLYAVKKDWNPGTGGVGFNNTSPPRPGEVWWNDVGFAERPWGLPGAGFASDHPEADTGTMPLADAVCRRGDSRLVFSSPRLTEYAAARIAAEKPLLLLIKVADFQEDVPGAWLTLYSANHGDTANTARRPRLILEWEAGEVHWSHEEEIFLEHGRSHTTPRFPIDEVESVAVSFFSEGGYEPPTIEERQVGASGSSDWSNAALPFRADSDWLELRVTAATNIVELGRSFTARVCDTWVVTAPPEEQAVRWTFVSPSGTEHRAEAAYRGDFTWEIEFRPDEIGPWRYSWTHRFIPDPYESATGRFDVVCRDRELLRARIREFAERLSELQPVRGSRRARRLGVQFSRLERSALLLETPETFRSASGEELREALAEVRELLRGAPMPRPLPMRSAPRPEDESRNRRQDREGLVRRLARKLPSTREKVLGILRGQTNS